MVNRRTLRGRRSLRTSRYRGEAETSRRQTGCIPVSQPSFCGSSILLRILVRRYASPTAAIRSDQGGTVHTRSPSLER